MADYRTYSMTQSSHITHSLSNRHPYVHNGRFQNVRPISPFAYPTRLKRPGYRPSSPALSLSRSMHSSDPDRGQSSRTASPASIYNFNRIPTSWQQAVNRSDPMLPYYPPMQRETSSKGSPSSQTRAYTVSRALHVCRKQKYHIRAHRLFPKA